jgi:cytosine/adenosine deaminase-related metal-dependent hydrolase
MADEFARRPLSLSHLSRRQFLGAGVAAGFSSLSADARTLALGFETFTGRLEQGVGSRDGCSLCHAAGGRPSPRAFYRTAPGSTPGSSLLTSAESTDAADQRAASAAGPQVDGKTIIVQPSWVVAPDGEKLQLLRDYDVVIKGDRIDDVRPRKSTRDQRVVAHGQILLAGFISGHTHSAAGTMTRGFIEENSFASVQTDDPSVPSRSLLRPMVLMEDLSDDELDDLTALNLAEMLRSGCTTQVEMSLSLKQMKSYVRVAARYGIRGYPGGMVPGIKRLLAIWGRSDDLTLLNSVQETLAEIEANLAFARQVNGTENGRIRPMMAPSVVSVHTRETFEAIRSAAQQLGNGIHIHIQNGWDPNDRKALQRYWGQGEIPILQTLGLLDAPMFGAHLLGIDLPKDLAVLARSKFTFAYCPSAAGASVLPSSQPYPEALGAGVNTCIGLDTHSNDYLENIKLGVMQGRARAQLLGRSSPVAMREPTIWNGLTSATLGGARGLARTDLGRVIPGAKADLCTVDVAGLLVGNGTLPREPYNNLLYANGLSVRNVMTDGNWQVRDGTFICDDEAQVVARGAAVVRKVWAQLDAEDFFVPMPR